ncbi:MAG: hypothetical protein E4H41_05985 [Gemmatimonadales bacterium]|jgi:hypothetical protein|nr:MAG: hypothetical protein E4H41_05985 [Gemmatimonadales bacterium]
MKSQKMFCSACDRPVRVLITEEPTSEGQAAVHDAELICLEIGAQCTGHLCPLGAAEPGAMVRRIVRNGIPLDSLQTVQADCPFCFSQTEMILYGDGKAGCSACGAEGRWVVDHLEPD